MKTKLIKVTQTSNKIIYINPFWIDFVVRKSEIDKIGVRCEWTEIYNRDEELPYNVVETPEEIMALLAE